MKCNILYKRFLLLLILSHFFILHAQITSVTKNENDNYKQILIADIAGFKNYDEYQAYLERVDFENFYKSLCQRKETNYFPGDIIDVPSQQLSIVNIETSGNNTYYLVSGCGQNQHSKYCIICSQYQIEYKNWYGEKLIIEEIFLEYIEKKIITQNDTLIECDSFSVLPPHGKKVENNLYKLKMADTYQKKDFDSLLEWLTPDGYLLLLNNNYNFATTPDIIHKMRSAFYEQSNYNEYKQNLTDYYKKWKFLFEYIINSSSELSKTEYRYLCEAFCTTDELNELLEKYIDKADFESKWFISTELLRNSKNLQTIISRLSDAKPYSYDFMYPIFEFQFSNEKIIETLLKKGLDCNILNDSNPDIVLYCIGRISPNILQLLINYGFNINLRIPSMGNTSLLTSLITCYEQEQLGGEKTINKEIIDCLIKNGAIQLY